MQQTEVASNIDINKHLKWRYATKKFDPTRQIDAKTWNVIEEALILTPSSFGLQPWKFVVITDKQIKDQLPSVSWNQNQPAECCHFVVLARLTKITADDIEEFINHTAQVRNLPLEKLQDYKNVMLGFIKAKSEEQLADWMAKQCYIALGNLMTVASIYGIDNCPMEGIDAKAYDQILGLKDKGCTTVVACALGYRASDDKYATVAKVRYPESKLIVRI